MGRSRSASLVIMYLMFRFKIPMRLAKELVQYRRRVVDPNNGFLQNIKTLENMMKDDEAI